MFQPNVAQDKVPPLYNLEFAFLYFIFDVFARLQGNGARSITSFSLGQRHVPHIASGHYAACAGHSVTFTDSNHESLSTPFLSGAGLARQASG